MLALEPPAGLVMAWLSNDVPARRDLAGDAVFAPFGLSVSDVAALRQVFKSWPR
jgi:ornithine cyclodeaminase/alanine dehydrogenase-like protein (mu-crystallin family)